MFGMQGRSVFYVKAWEYNADVSWSDKISTIRAGCNLQVACRQVVERSSEEVMERVSNLFKDKNNFSNKRATPRPPPMVSLFKTICGLIRQNKTVVVDTRLC